MSYSLHLKCIRASRDAPINMSYFIENSGKLGIRSFCRLVCNPHGKAGGDQQVDHEHAGLLKILCQQFSKPVPHWIVGTVVR
jgi:hypothetical protein